MQSSRLTEFYQAYSQWLLDGSPCHSEPFNRAMGLCIAIRAYGRTQDWGRSDVTDEMERQFIEAGLDRLHPFNRDGDQYVKEMINSRAHLNVKRIQWVMQHINP